METDEILDQFYDSSREIFGIIDNLEIIGRDLKSVGNDKLGDEILELAGRLYTCKSNCDQAFNKQLHSEFQKQRENMGSILKTLLEGR